MTYLTQFYYEKTWTKVDEKEVLRLIKEEFPDIPAEEMYAYVQSECAKGKTITVGECKFKQA